MSGELWEECGLMIVALVSGYQEVWVQALAGDIAVFWDTTLYSHSASLSLQGHPTEVFRKISVPQREFSWLGN